MLCMYPFCLVVGHLILVKILDKILMTIKVYYYFLLNFIIYILAFPKYIGENLKIKTKIINDANI